MSAHVNVDICTFGSYVLTDFFELFIPHDGDDVKTREIRYEIEKN